MKLKITCGVSGAKKQGSKVTLFFPCPAIAGDGFNKRRELSFLCSNPTNFGPHRVWVDILKIVIRVTFLAVDVQFSVCSSYQCCPNTHQYAVNKNHLNFSSFGFTQLVPVTVHNNC